MRRQGCSDLYEGTCWFYKMLQSFTYIIVHSFRIYKKKFPSSEFKISFHHNYVYLSSLKDSISSPLKVYLSELKISVSQPQSLPIRV